MQVQRPGPGSDPGVWTGSPSTSMPGPLPTAQCHPGARGDIQLGVRGAPGPLCQQPRCLQPQQVEGLEGPEWLVGALARNQRLTPRSLSAACLPSRFPKPPQPIVLRDCQVLPLPPGLPLSHSQELAPGAPPSGPQPRPSTAVDPNVEPTLLRHPQVKAPALG